MRVVLDTNVLISGVFFGGIPGRILSAWAAGRFDLVLSPPILDEYQRVGRELARRHPELGSSLEPILALLTANAIMIDAPTLPEPVTADPADEMFLAAASAAGAGLIVSGDHHLLAVSGWRGVTVLKPRQFATLHIASFDS